MDSLSRIMGSSIMDNFGDNFEDNDVDPAAEFLAREQNELAGLEDELKPVAPPVVNGNYLLYYHYVSRYLTQICNKTR